MRNENLYRYLTRKCKERCLPIESMPEMFEFSRSSLYRYMKGLIRMSPEVQAKFVRILNFDEAEQEEFKRLVGLAEFDSSLIDARYALDDFVFGRDNGKKKPDSIKFAYYENDIFLRTSDEIFALIQSLSVQQGASCKIRIINCLEGSVCDSVTSFLESVFAAPENVEAEHLLVFHGNDYLQKANTLIAIIPLLKFKNYSVYQSTTSASTETKTMFGNVLIVDIQLKDAPPKYFFISFLDDDLSTCLVTSDKNIFAFTISNYEAFKKSYRAALLNSASLDLFGNQIAELQKNNNCYLMKPNCCYDRIPIAALHSLVSRLTPDELKRVQEGVTGMNNDETSSLDQIFASLERRVAASYENHHIDVFSVDGLTQLAKNGRVSDHLDFLPSFNEEERRSIFEYIRDRSNDLHDKYTLYITKEKLLENGYIVIAIENVGIMIEYNPEEYQKGICNNLFIENRMLSELISDYIKNHMPDNHVLKPNEATTFLDSLIQSLQ